MHPIAKAYVQYRLKGLAPSWAARQAVYTADYVRWQKLVDVIHMGETQEAYLQRYLDEVRQYLPDELKEELECTPQ